MKRVAGSLRLDLAAFRELEAFAQLGTELDKATQRQLDRGYRMVELLKQPQYEPRPVADQVIAIFAGTQGYFDKFPASEVARAEKELITFMKETRFDVRNKIVQTGALDDATMADLRKALDEFLKQSEAAGLKMVAAS
jgi:F-type H+-transporting ATPase subunit alpha